LLGTKKKEETLPVNEALLNVITPMGLEIKRNSLVIGENMGKVYGAVRYPQKVEMGWLSKITNIPSTIVSVGITPIDNSTLISALSKSIVQQRGAADSAKDPLTRQRAEKAAEDDRFADLKNKFEQVEAELKDDTQTNLETYRTQVVETINNDIVMRHGYQAGVIEHSLSGDKEVKKAVEVLGDPAEYARITREQDTKRK